MRVGLLLHPVSCWRMRLLLLPLDRAQQHSLLYCQKLLSPLVRAKPRLDDRVVKIMGRAWDKFRTSDSAWKQSLTKLALRVLDSTPYEEIGLRSVPPKNMWMRQLSRSQTLRIAHVAPAVAKAESLELEPVNVVYAPGDAFRVPNDVIAQINNLAKAGIRRHRRGMFLCAIGLPLTLPLALIPVLPNIPGIYLTYRLWCNWKAWQGAQHLSYLVGHDQLRPVELPAVSYAYRTVGADMTPELIERLDCIFGDVSVANELKQASRQVAARNAKDDSDQTA